jgi:hypothetical protein
MREARSAVIVAIPIPAPLERIRRANVPLALSGVPPHVTVLFPFVPAADLRTADRRRLVAIAGVVPAFDVAFRSLERFDDALYLEPDGNGPFRRLTVALAAAWPACPPSGDPAIAPDDVVPHLTLSIGEPEAFDGLAAVAVRSLPFVRQVSHLTVIVEDASGRWRTRWRIPLRS